MKVTIWPSEPLISSRTALSRSSNSPRYLAPATMEARSRAIRVLPRRLSGTSLATIRWARPSTTAVLPTPGSPMMTGLFLVRRLSTWMMRRISASRPITGSSLPERAIAVRSVPYFSSAWKVFSGSAESTLRSPRMPGRAASRASWEAPASRISLPTASLPDASPSSRCSVETKVSPSRSASFWAFLMACRAVRDSCGCCTELPEVDGRALMAVLAWTLTESGSVPVARRSATATPSRWSMSALSRWAGSSWGFPAVEAFMAAAERASWLLVVNLASKESSFREHADIKVESTPLNFACRSLWLHVCRRRNGCLGPESPAAAPGASASAGHALRARRPLDIIPICPLMARTGHVPTD